MEQNFNYEHAMAQKKMESGELDIDSLCQQLKTAKQLIRQCRDKLTKTDEEIKKLLEE